MKAKELGIILIIAVVVVIGVLVLIAFIDAITCPEGSHQCQIGCDGGWGCCIDGCVTSGVGDFHCEYPWGAKTDVEEASK